MTRERAQQISEAYKRRAKYLFQQRRYAESVEADRKAVRWALRAKYALSQDQQHNQDEQEMP